MKSNNEQMYILNENRFNKPAINADTGQEMENLISLGSGVFIRPHDETFVTYISVDPISWEKTSVNMYKVHLNPKIFEKYL